MTLIEGDFPATAAASNKWRKSTQSAHSRCSGAGQLWGRQELLLLCASPSWVWHTPKPGSSQWSTAEHGTIVGCTVPQAVAEGRVSVSKASSWSHG